MKRMLNYVAILAGVAIIFSMGCKKDETTSPASLNLTNKGIIKGLVQAQLDLMNDTLAATLEFAPAGTNVFVKVASAQYTNQGDVAALKAGDTNLGFITYSTTIGANGEYSIEVPATDKGVEFTVWVDDFSYSQKTIKKDDLGAWVYDVPERKVYETAETTGMIVPKQTKIIDFDCTIK